MKTLVLSALAVGMLSACAHKQSTSQTNDSATNCTENAKDGVEKTDSITGATIKTFNVAGVDIDMVKVDGGQFKMGATPEQGTKDPDPDEKNIHNVTISTFYLGKYEVTQKLWTAVMGNNPSVYTNDNAPVEMVSWEDCETFINKLNSISKLNFRMPTEAEWEFAARGGVKSKNYKYSGSNKLDEVGWYIEATTDDEIEGEPHEVGLKKPNEIGIYDMSGNVWEWCQDWYRDQYEGDNLTDPLVTEPNNLRARCFRGGSWYGNSARYCRTANRSGNFPDYKSHVGGLRLAINAK